MHLETPRLIIRKYLLTDIYDIYEYTSDEQVAIAAGWNVHDSLSTTLRTVVAMSQQPDSYAIVNKSDGKIIGGIGLYNDSARHNDHGRSLGYALNRNYWGKGLITEAANAVITMGFEVMQLQLISATHYPFNSASARVLNKLGFTYEGRLRHCSVVLKGQVYDEMFYSLTREEYLAHKK